MTDSLPKLTAKQEKALTHFRLHGNKSAAYRHAYVTAKMGEGSINVEATRLFDHPKLTQWLAAFAKEDKEEFSIERSDIIKRLRHIADLGVAQSVDPYGVMKSENLNAATSALKEINAMEGHHAPAQTILSGPGGGPVKVTREWVVNPVKPGPVREINKG